MAKKKIYNDRKVLATIAYFSFVSCLAIIGLTLLWVSIKNDCGIGACNLNDAHALLNDTVAGSISRAALAIAKASTIVSVALLVYYTLREK